MELAVRAISNFLSGLILVGALLFGAAGTLEFGAAWRFLALLFFPMMGIGIWLLAKEPGLLEKRLSGREGQKTQKILGCVFSVEFAACFVLAGLDERFGWTHLSGKAIVSACILFLAGYGLYIEVMRENAYLSRTVEIQPGQKVVDTGLYGIVRHPMYAASVLLFWSMPLILDSLPGFLVMLPYPFFLAVRIRNEELVLKSGLEGYREYMQKVRFRLLPFIW